MQSISRKIRLELSQYFLLICSLEGLLVLAVLMQIPADPKHQFLWGYSFSRVILISMVFGMTALFFLAVMKKSLFINIFHWLRTLFKHEKLVYFLGFSTFLLIWIILWLPQERLKDLEANYVRLRPVLFWLGLIGLQLFFLIQKLNQRISFEILYSRIKNNKIMLLISLGTFLLFAFTYLFLAKESTDFGAGLLFFAPGTALSSYQMFFAIAGYVFCLLFLNPGVGKVKSSVKLVLLVFFMIWGITFLIWSATSFSCTNDRMGPFPPNYVCYPAINDAVYSVGSHYITLGNGVNNQWFTDKPAYMVILAIGQWLLGPNIDRYIFFPIFIVSSLPALLFMASKRLLGFYGGLLLASLAVIQEVNQIQYFAQIASVHVHLENPESLIAVVLLLVAIFLFKWLDHPTENRDAIIAGGLIGIATLIRVNAAMIMLFMLIPYIFLIIKYKRKILLTGLFFIVSFTLVFAPWLFTAKDNVGNYRYLKKLQAVLSLRAVVGDSSNAYEELAVETETAAQENRLGMLDKFFSKDEASDSANEPSVISNIGFHLMNNIYSGYASFPTEFKFTSLEKQFTTPLWEADAQAPIWRKSLSSENYIMLAANFLVVMLGMMTAWRKYRLAGLSPLIVQMGYYLGNAVALTSGGRYQLPVNWVNLLYFAVGICVCITFCLSIVVKTLRDSLSDNFISGKKVQALPGKKGRYPEIGLLGFFLGIGAILPVLNALPKQLPPDSTEKTALIAYQYLANEDLVSEAEWLKFQQDSEALLIEGSAYHASYRRNSYINQNGKTFEVMVLANEYVYPSYLYDVEPDKEFFDGSHVIIIGCNLGQDGLWGMKRKNVKAISIINLDQGLIYSQDKPSWNCE